jgi:hypothetical protein
MFTTSFITAWVKNNQFRRQYKAIAMLLETHKNPAFQPRSDSQGRALKDVNRQLFSSFFLLGDFNITPVRELVADNARNFKQIKISC